MAVPIDKHGSVKILPHPFDHTYGVKGQIFKFAITKAVVNIFLLKFCMQEEEQ